MILTFSSKGEQSADVHPYHEAKIGPFQGRAPYAYRLKSEWHFGFTLSRPAILNTVKLEINIGGPLNYESAELHNYHYPPEGDYLGFFSGYAPLGSPVDHGFWTFRWFRGGWYATVGGLKCEASAPTPANLIWKYEVGIPVVRCDFRAPELTHYDWNTTLLEIRGELDITVCHNLKADLLLPSIETLHWLVPGMKILSWIDVQNIGACPGGGAVVYPGTKIDILLNPAESKRYEITTLVESVTQKLEGRALEARHIHSPEPYQKEPKFEQILKLVSAIGMEGQG